MKKHIGFFVSSLNTGGVERAFVTLANSFIEDGHQVDFVVCQNIGDLKGELSSKINVINFGDGRLRNSFLKLYQYINKSSIEYLITGPTYPNIIALLCNALSYRRIKIIISQHSYQDIEMTNLGLLGRLAPFLIRRTYNFAEKIIAVSTGVKDDLIQNYKIMPNKIVVIYNAVLNKSFYDRAIEGIPKSIIERIGSKPYIVAVGRLELVKNYSFMLKSFAIIKHTMPKFKYDLVILGDGSEFQNLRKEIIELGIGDSVHLLGNLVNPLPVVKKAKVFVHTSLSEAMSLVYIEALALNVPVVTIVNKGANEILKDIQQKIIIQSFNNQEFIEGILKALEMNFTENLPDLNEFDVKVIRDSYLSLM